MPPMPEPDPRFDITDESQLQALLPAPNQASIAKELGQGSSPGSE